jgi:hypothetical protein
MAKELAELRTRDGQPYGLFELPWARPILDEGRRLAASYANFLIVNGAVLMPAYGDEADVRAALTLARPSGSRDRAGGLPAADLAERQPALPDDATARRSAGMSKVPGKRSLRVALVQERNQEDSESNLALIERRVETAAARGAQLVLLQELHNGAYFCQHQDVCEFEQAEAIPARAPSASARWRKSTAW